VGENWARKLGLVTPPCALCVSDKDEVIHVLFHCNFARAVWIASPLGIRSNLLPTSFRQIYTSLHSQPSQSQFKLFLNTLWALWKVRCSHIYEGKPASPLKAVRLALDLSNMGLTLPIRSIQQQGNIEVLSDQSTYIHCFVDGSYSDNGSGQKGGWALVLRKGQELIQYEAGASATISPLHSEITAVQMATQVFSSRSNDQGDIFTDCQQLAEALSSMNPPLHLDWRLYTQLVQIWLFFRDNTRIRCLFKGRDHNRETHYLANWARLMNMLLVLIIPFLL